MRKRGRQAVGTVRLGYRKHLREIAMKRIRPQRLMLIEGLRGVDHDRISRWGRIRFMAISRRCLR